MTRRPNQKRSPYSVEQLDFVRRALEARLEHVSADEESNALIAQIESLDLQLAATPAESLNDLRVKFNRLLDILAVDLTDLSTLDAVFLSGVKRDLDGLRFKEPANEDEP